MPAILTLDGLDKSFGAIRVAQSLSFAVGAGEAVSR